jgi:DNA repair protein RecN (Recombination protein N)
MLAGLSVRDIVLIERLDLEFEPGLCVLTGETGTGKSILLDALGLAIGARADAGLIGHGAERGSVAAAFQVPTDHPALEILEAGGLDGGETLILRRVLTPDGRGRAFVNDQPIAVGLLRRLGECLVEVHGQHDERGLLNAAGHRALLDEFAVAEPLRRSCRKAHQAVEAAAAALAEAEAALARDLGERDYLEHVLAELERLAPRSGEEAELVATRQRLRQGEKLVEALTQATAALAEPEGIDTRLRRAERALARVAELAGGQLDAVLEGLGRAAVEAMEALALVEQAGAELAPDPHRLEAVEERLFALREVARKHRTGVDSLARLQDEFAARLGAMAAGEERLEALRAGVAGSRERFTTAVAALGRARQKAAKRLDRAVARELGPLKLENAVFQTRLQPLAESEWSAEGGERVGFLVATNPGAEPGPLNRIASGGELARFMLALKVALAGTKSAQTLVFDEVDRGVGGAVADRVGARLAALAETAQVLVVTHSPQVAARAAHHWHVVKDEADDGARTTVVKLGDKARREEIARMLAGAEITAEARAAAGSLIAAAEL